MTTDQTYCVQMLEEWAGGAHHLPKVHEFGTGVCINYFGDLSTFDYDRLTSLVLLAHRDAVRVEISHSGPRRVRIICHRRRHGEGRMCERHPSLQDLVGRINTLIQNP